MTIKSGVVGFVAGVLITGLAGLQPPQVEYTFESTEDFPMCVPIMGEVLSSVPAVQPLIETSTTPFIVPSVETVIEPIVKPVKVKEPKPQVGSISGMGEIREFKKEQIMRLTDESEYLNVSVEYQVDNFVIIETHKTLNRSIQTVAVNMFDGLSLDEALSEETQNYFKNKLQNKLQGTGIYILNFEWDNNWL